MSSMISCGVQFRCRQGTTSWTVIREDDSWGPRPRSTIWMVLDISSTQRKILSPPGILMASCLPYQLAQRLGIAFDQVLRSAIEVGDRGRVDVDAEVAVERGIELAERDGARDRFAGNTV